MLTRSYDTRVLRNFCANKELMQDFEHVVDGECIYMGNSTTTRIIGKGKILSKFTSGKSLSFVEKKVLIFKNPKCKEYR